MKANLKPCQQPRQVQRPQSNEMDPVCNNEESPTRADVPKKKSMLSEVFKVPSTPVRKDSAPSSIQKPPVVTRSKSLTCMSPSSTPSSPHMMSTHPLPSTSKGITNNFDNLTSNGSITEKKIRESQQNANELQEFLNENPVTLFLLNAHKHLLKKTFFLLKQGLSLPEQQEYIDQITLIEKKLLHLEETQKLEEREAQLMKNIQFHRDQYITHQDNSEEMLMRKDSSLGKYLLN